MRKGQFLDLERRKFPRLEGNIFIILRPLDGDFHTKFKAFTRNIDVNGLMFETERGIPVQSELELEIYQPMSRYKNIIFSIPALVKVIWIKKIEKNGFEEGENKYRIGVEFLNIEEEDRQRIAKYVEENALEK